MPCEVMSAGIPQVLMTKGQDHSYVLPKKNPLNDIIKIKLKLSTSIPAKLSPNNTYSGYLIRKKNTFIA